MLEVVYLLSEVHSMEFGTSCIVSNSIPYAHGNVYKVHDETRKNIFSYFIVL